MPRTLAPELEAVNNQGYNVAFRVKAWGGRGTSLQGQTTDILGFKITRTELQVETTPHFDVTASFLQLLRGANIGGTEYTIGTTYYSIHKVELFQHRRIFYASLIPRMYVSIAGDDTYENVITNFCTAIGMTAEFKNPSAAFWGYQFYPDDTQLTLNDARAFVSLLRQKYLITVSDIEGDVIQFASYLDSSDTADIEAPPLLNNPYTKFTVEPGGIKFYWRDETNTPHVDGSATVPSHNLGYLESTASPPAPHVNSGAFVYGGQVDLRIVNDDNIFNDEEEFVLQAEIVETFQPNSTPSWNMTLSATAVFGTGSNLNVPTRPAWLPTDNQLNMPRENGQPAPPWLPTGGQARGLLADDVYTGRFTGVLSEYDTSLQEALETVDKHTHSLLPAAPIQSPTAANDFLVGEQIATVWTWAKKTLAQTITILRTSLDSVYAAIAHTHEVDQRSDMFNDGEGDPAAIGTAADGTSTYAARRDHVHAKGSHTHKYRDAYATHLNFATVAAGATQWAAPFLGATASEAGQLVTAACTAKNFYTRTATAQPGTGSLVFMLRKNGADTAVTFTIAAGGAAGNYSDTSNSVSIAAGDRIAFRIVNNASGASAQIAPLLCDLEYDTA